MCDVARRPLSSNSSRDPREEDESRSAACRGHRDRQRSSRVDFCSEELLAAKMFIRPRGGGGSRAGDLFAIMGFIPLVRFQTFSCGFEFLWVKARLVVLCAIRSIRGCRDIGCFLQYLPAFLHLMFSAVWRTFTMLTDLIIHSGNVLQWDFELPPKYVSSPRFLKTNDF